MDGVVERKCADCIFYEKMNHPSYDGTCLRYPPHIIKDDNIYQNVFPMVLEQFWCGEFKDKWSNVRKEMGDP